MSSKWPTLADRLSHPIVTRREALEQLSRCPDVTMSDEAKKELEELQKNDSICQFCGMITYTRGHHIIPRCKGGKLTVPTCMTCESFIHHTWSHNELRDVYNSVEAILATDKFQKFLRWRRKQPADTMYSSEDGKTRSKRKYS